MALALVFGTLLAIPVAIVVGVIALGIVVMSIIPDWPASTGFAALAWTLAVTVGGLLAVASLQSPRPARFSC